MRDQLVSKLLTNKHINLVKCQWNLPNILLSYDHDDKKNVHIWVWFNRSFLWDVIRKVKNAKGIVIWRPSLSDSRFISVLYSPFGFYVWRNLQQEKRKIINQYEATWWLMDWSEEQWKWTSYREEFNFLPLSVLRRLTGLMNILK